MIKNLFILCLISLTINAFSQDTAIVNGYKIFYYQNKVKSSEGQLKNGQPEGYWKTYWENGNIKSEGNRKNFKLDSLWKFYNEKGEITSSITYLDGLKNGAKTTYFDDKIIVENYKLNIKEGKYTEYYKSGNIKLSTSFSEGFEDGYHVEFTEDGRITSITKFRKGFMLTNENINMFNEDGKKIGLWKEYYPGEDYVIKNEGTYRDGEKDGYFKFYDATGNLEKIEKYVNGVFTEDAPELAKYEIKTDYYPDGSPKVIGSYKDGLAEGVRREYSPDGKIVAAYIMSKGAVSGMGIIDETGLRQGKWSDFHENGKILAEGLYENSVRVGEWKFYHENGALEQIGSYSKKGNSFGTWKWYYDDGTLRREETFVEGVPDGQMQEFDSKGGIMVKGEYSYGEPNGPWLSTVHGWREEGEYVEGIKEGVWKFFYPNNQLLYQGKYVDDTPDEKHEWYYSNGMLKISGNYAMGVREGEWKYFDEAGQLFLTITYNSGIETKIDSKVIEPQLLPSDFKE